MLHISPGNSKLGKIVNISLPPVISCPKNVPCANDGCYAKRIYKFREVARNAWNDNLNTYKLDPQKYFNEINIYLKKRSKRITRFRWHTSGDILDQEYYNGMEYVAFENPNVKFLAFTKNKEIQFNSNKPKNLIILFSNWKNYLNTTTVQLNSWVN